MFGPDKPIGNLFIFVLTFVSNKVFSEWLIKLKLNIGNNDCNLMTSKALFTPFMGLQPHFFSSTEIEINWIFETLFLIFCFLSMTSCREISSLVIFEWHVGQTKIRFSMTWFDGFSSIWWISKWPTSSLSQNGQIELISFCNSERVLFFWGIFVFIFFFNSIKKLELQNTNNELLPLIPSSLIKSHQIKQLSHTWAYPITVAFLQLLGIEVGGGMGLDVMVQEQFVTR